MKIIKRILIVLVVIIAIPLIVALFVKKEYHVKRQVEINKPVTEVFNYIKLLKNQDNFSKWNNIDTTMEKTYKGTDGTVGFISAWNSKNKDVGVGEQEITKIDEGKRVDFELRFKVPFESNDLAYMTTESLSDSTTMVTWGLDGKMSYPTNLMLLTMDFDKMLGGDLQYGLDKLKTILEKN